jgi:integrase/recombinase XerD
VVDNLKHKTLLVLIYSKGLLYAEAGRLKINDIDNNRNLIYFNTPKDKYMILPDAVLGTVREYYKVYRPKEYLFEDADRRKWLVMPVQKRLKSKLVLVNRHLERFQVHWSKQSSSQKRNKLNASIMLNQADRRNAITHYLHKIRVAPIPG